MYQDRFGQPITTQSARALDLYDKAVDRMFALQPGSNALIDEALDLDPEFALGHCTKARALAGAGDGAGARRHATRGRDLAARLPERERRHAEIVSLVFHGESMAALDAVRDHAAAYPRDAVPLSFALGVYGLLGFGGFNDFREQQVELLAGVAHAWGEEDWWFLAFYGWALVEAGSADAGIAMLDRALELRPDNANAVHGRAHGYYEQGAAGEGEAFIEAWLPGYDRSAILHSHLGWHVALFALQRGDAERAADVYRDCIRPPVSQTLPMFTMIDCASFLTHTAVAGHPLGMQERRELAAFVAERFAKLGVPFVNAHLAMAYAAFADADALAELEEGVAVLLDDGKQPSGPVVAQLCSAVTAYAGGRYARAASHLDRALPDLDRMGGSNAQRDVFIDLAISAYLRSGDQDAARQIARSRYTRRAGHLDDGWLQRLCAKGGIAAASEKFRWREISYDADS